LVLMGAGEKVGEAFLGLDEGWTKARPDWGQAAGRRTIAREKTWGGNRFCGGKKKM